MAEEVLDLGGGGAVFGQAGGQGVAQCVDQGASGDSGADAGEAVALADQVLGAPGAQLAVVAVDEQGSGRGGPLGRESGSTGLQVALEDRFEGRFDRDEPLFAAFGLSRRLHPISLMVINAFG